MDIPFRGKLVDFWERVSTSYWFVPSAMLVGSVLLAAGSVRLDYFLLSGQSAFAVWVTPLQASAARTILSTLAGSFATIAGVVFSITVVALQLASSQFGPHVLRAFLGDRGNQVTLGTFVSAFAYCIVIIASVRGDNAFVPRVAVAVGIVIGMISTGVLIYFIHHIANFIRADTIVASLTRQLHQTIDRLFPEELGHGATVPRQEPPRGSKNEISGGKPIIAVTAGYIRRLDDPELMRLAAAADVVVLLLRRPGDFVIPGDALMIAAPGDRIEKDRAEALCRTVIVGPDRTHSEDIDFALEQLVEVAMRALSPGINNPFTALSCIDRLGEGLCRIAQRRTPGLLRYDEDGRLRVIVAQARPLSVLTEQTLGSIARAARDTAMVVTRLIETAHRVRTHARAESDRGAIAALAEAIADEFAAISDCERDRARVREALNHGGETGTVQAARLAADARAAAI